VGGFTPTVATQSAVAVAKGSFKEGLEGTQRALRQGPEVSAAVEVLTDRHGAEQEALEVTAEAHRTTALLVSGAAVGAHGLSQQLSM